MCAKLCYSPNIMLKMKQKTIKIITIFGSFFMINQTISQTILPSKNNTKPIPNQTSKPVQATKREVVKKTEVMAKKTDKLVISQIMTHLWGNKKSANKVNGSLEENGVTKFKDFDDLALQKLKNFGYSHLYMTGLLEHATMEDYTSLGIERDHPDVVKGRAGSPFAVKDYYDVNPFLASNPKNRMKEFESMLTRIHGNGLKLIMDCVPNHVARYYHSDMKPAGVKDFGEGDDSTKPFDPQNNFYYLPNTTFKIPDGVKSPVKLDYPYKESPAKASGNDVFTDKPSIDDWFETVKLNYGVDYQNGRAKKFEPIPSTWVKMADALVYWTKKGVDGFRCDMAEMVPVEFWAYCITRVKEANPKVIFIAEIYNPKEYKNYISIGKFDYLYDKVGLYDALRRLIEDNPAATVEDITKVWQNESGEFPEHMLRFMENHDEQRVNSKYFANGDPFKAIPAMIVSATLHTGPLMIYFGQEVGESAIDAEGFGREDGRTTMFDFWGVPDFQKWYNGGKFDGAKLTDIQKFLLEFYQDLLKFTNKSDAVKYGAFYDLQYVQGEGYDRKKVYSYLRHSDKQKLLIVCNFDHNKEQNIEVNIPEGAWNAMKLKPVGTYNFKGLFNQKTTISGESTKGLSIKVSPNSFVIYEILEKK